jgi:hypothetical protein
VLLSNGNKLSKVHNAAEIISGLNSVKNEASEVYLWRFVGSSKYIGLTRIESVRKQRGDFCIVPSEGQDRIIQELLSGQTQIDLYIPAKSTLMRCRIRQTDAPFRYYLEFPQFMAQVERRKELRLNAYDQKEITVSFGKTITLPRTMSQYFLKSCFDVSTGGISFLVSKTESKLFQESDLISTMEMKTSDWNAKISTQVLSIRETDPDEVNGFPYKVWRVSCKITQMDPVAKKQLEKFIFERIKDELHAING